MSVENLDKKQVKTQVKTSVILVEERKNPSTDYFVLPAFSSNEFEVTRYDFSTLVDSAALQGAVVVFVRYIPRAWKTLVTKHLSKIQSIYYFMDDDLFDLSATKNQTWRYRWKLFSKAYIHQAWLRKTHAQILVSTPFLKHKYLSVWQPELIEPKPLKKQLLHIQTYQEQATLIREPESDRAEEIVLFYHGSASHQAEIDWLYPIVKELLNRFPLLRFELIATTKVAKEFACLDRVTLVKPMGWSEYQQFLFKSKRHIGLAPVLDSPFNQARSYTKFFDITVAGAVSVLPLESIFAQFLSQNADKANNLAKFVTMQPQDWVDAISELILNTDLREKMSDSAQQWLLSKYADQIETAE